MRLCYIFRILIQTSVGSLKSFRKMSEMLKTAREIMKESAFNFMLWGHEHYGSPFEFLTQETDERGATWAYIVHELLDDKDDGLYSLVLFADLSLEYDCLYEEYFRDCISNILAIPELENRHEKAKAVLIAFEGLKETESYNKMNLSLLYKAAGIEQ
jgi:hypothetical protein